ncbi:MAG: two component transcriptional regulator, LuxR family [Rhodospirillales bacterium]|nr:two component transcriptional regulator, LuxR family [Rhodospirillales bacterium]
MASVTTIHIIDDDEALRRSLGRLLRAEGFATVSYDSSLSFIDMASNLAPGCILLDVRMPGMDGLELLARLKWIGLRLPVILMTGVGDIAMAVQAMKAGAADFIEKPFDDAGLLKAIAAALSMAAGEPHHGEAAVRVGSLSPREREVLDALVAGRSNKVIAFDLGLSVRTVEVHRARMLKRLGTHSLAEAVRLAVIATLDREGAEPLDAKVPKIP